MHTQFEQNKAFSKKLDEHSSILQNISKQLERLNSDISNLQTRLTTTETYVSNMSHTQDTLINQMEAKPEVIPKEEDKIKSLPTHHMMASRPSLVTPSERFEMQCSSKFPLERC